MRHRATNDFRQQFSNAPGGFSGPELFTRAWRAFTDILKTERIEYT